MRRGTPTSGSTGQEGGCRVNLEELRTTVLQSTRICAVPVCSHLRRKGAQGPGGRAGSHPGQSRVSVERARDRGTNEAAGPHARVWTEGCPPRAAGLHPQRLRGTGKGAEGLRVTGNHHSKDRARNVDSSGEPTGGRGASGDQGRGEGPLTATGPL